MQDGYTQVGAGQSDMRIAGDDLQHNRQPRTADEWHVPVRMVRRSAGEGGPMKEYLDREAAQHKIGRALRLEHLKQSYER